MTLATVGSPAAPRTFKRVLKGADTLLFTVCAILTIDQLTALASVGVSAIFWWIFTLILFFIPYGLITAELASKYPQQGGIYAWVKRAYGPRWAARTCWLYWVSVALWMPSVYLMFSGILAQILNIELSLWSQISLAVVLTWITVWLSITALEIGKWVPNVGAVLKAVIMLAIGCGGFWYASQHGVANEFSFAAMAPKLTDSLGFLPLIVYSFLGLELISGASEEIQNPEQNAFKRTALSGISIAAFYLLGTVGILCALPLEKISLVDGLIDTLRMIFGTSAAANATVFTLGLATLYSLYANMVAWSMGANRAIAEAAYRNDLPTVFGRLHPVNQTPYAASIITGIVATAVIVLYGLMAADAEHLFWALFKFATIILLTPYLLMFPAFIHLRRHEPPPCKTYSVPGGMPMAVVLAGLCLLFIVQAIVLFVWVPGEAFLTYETLAIALGIALVLIVGESLIQQASRSFANSSGAFVSMPRE